jgi:transposase
MVFRLEDLPSDPGRLIEMVLALEAENDRLRAVISTFKDMVFGARSEKLAAVVADQLALDLDDVAIDVAPPAAANDDHVPEKPAGAGGMPRKKAQRNIGALPKHLPRCEQVIEPETTVCPCCQGLLHRIGQDVSEVLDVIPAILRVLRMIRPKYACRGCEGTVVQAKALPRLIENSMASTALVTQVVVSKFAWFIADLDRAARMLPADRDRACALQHHGRPVTAQG